MRLRYAGGLWFDKPPLAMWATALFYKLFGVSEFSSRLFASLCGTGTVWLTYAFGKKLWGSWTGFCGAALLVCSSFFIRYARFGTLDSPLTFFLALALWFFWAGRERPALYWASGAALGAAFMTKGFASLVFFPILFLWAAGAGEWAALRRREFAGLVLAAAAVALPWHAAQIAEFGDAFWRDVVVKHLFTRTTQAVEGHAGGWYFYFRALINKFRPAIFLGAGAIPYFLWRAFRRRESGPILIASWALVGFAAATAVRTKLDWYIFPVLPPLSLATGFVLARFVRPRFFWLVAAAALASVCLHGFHSRRFFQDYSRPIRALADQVRRDVPAGTFTYLVRYHEDPAATFYWGRPVADLDEEKALAEALERKPFFALVRGEDFRAWKPAFDRGGTEVRAQSDGFYWVASVV